MYNSGNINAVTVESKYQTESVVRRDHVWSMVRPLAMVTLFLWLRLRWSCYFHTRNFPSRRPARASTGSRHLHSNCADTLLIPCR